MLENAHWTRAYVPMFARDRGLPIASVLAAVVGVASEALGLVAVGAIVATDENSAKAITLGMAAGAGLLGSAALRALSEGCIIRHQVRLEQRLRHDLTRAVLDSDWQDFVNVEGHEIQSALLAEAPQVASAASTLLRAISSAFAACVVLVAALAVSPVTAGLCCAAALAIAALVGRGLRGLGAIQTDLAQLTASMTRKSAILIGGLRTLRLSPIQDAWRRDLAETYSEHARARMADSMIPLRARLIAESAAAMLVSAVLVTSIAMGGDILAGLVAMALILRILPRVQSGHQQWRVAQHGATWLNRWSERFDQLTALSQVDVDTQVHEAEEGLRFNSVSFRYRGHQREVLSGVELAILPGETIWFMGASGTGKSTLLDIAGGVLRPTHGQVLLNGVPLETLSPDVLHARLAIVPQEPQLWGRTVHDVLTWEGRIEEGERERAVMSDLGIDAMFMFGHSEIGQIDEQGRDISGGMRARLAIGRALMTEPEVLILDETTSRLPQDAEQEILSAVRERCPDLMLIVVSHRQPDLSAEVRGLVLSQGAVLETTRTSGAAHQ